MEITRNPQLFGPQEGASLKIFGQIGKTSQKWFLLCDSPRKTTPTRSHDIPKWFRTGGWHAGEMARSFRRPASVTDEDLGRSQRLSHHTVVAVNKHACSKKLTSFIWTGRREQRCLPESGVEFLAPQRKAAESY